MAGDLEAAERELVAGHEYLEKIGENELRSTIAARLAHVLYEQGRHDEADRFARTSESAAAADDIFSQVLWRSALAKVLAHRDRDPHADELAAEAVSMAATTDFLRLHGGALLDLAHVRALLNGSAAPPDIVAEARRLLERKEDASTLRRAAEFSGLAAAH
jgi:hypothetical protein